MARKRKGGGSSLAGVGFAVLVLVASTPKSFWVVAGGVVALLIAVYLVLRFKAYLSKPVLVEQPVRSSAPPIRSKPQELPKRLAVKKSFERPSPPPRLTPAIASAVLSPVRLETPPLAPSNPLKFEIPKAPKEYGPGAWVPPGDTVTIAGISISGGMIYVGNVLVAFNGRTDPCLIDPTKSVSAGGDYTQRAMGYWPSYSEISDGARRSYLNWLAGGRKDPTADIGYVFLFFYGLERRVILDGSKGSQAALDRPVIAEEIRRLISIYGSRSGSFRRYAGELLNWLLMVEFSAELYKEPVPQLPQTLELPFYVRLALGQTAVHRAPVPAHLAQAWAKLDPACNLRTPAVRCDEQFDQLFVQIYAKQFGYGLVLPQNRTKLRFVYTAASAGFKEANITLNFGDVPDVTVLTAPIRKIQAVVEEATIALEAYSRYLGRNASSPRALEGLLQLPATLWPPEAQQVFAGLRARMGEGMIAMSFQELLTKLDAQSILNRDRTLALARALESLNIGIEPDVLAGAKLPKPDDKVVLFAVPPGEVTSRATPAYLAATLTLQLASAVAAADGEFSVGEMSMLRRQIQSWTHLTPNHIRRLMAQLRLLMIAPVSLSSLKKRLAPLDAQAKETVAAFMTTVAQSDGSVTPAEVKMLEQVYKALGVEPKRVFSDVHAAATGTTLPSSVAPAKPAVAGGFKLDEARIAALQKGSDQVSALLAGIFKDDEAAAAVETPSAPVIATDDESPAASALLGLDEQHAALARMLLSRPQWTRPELLDIAADLDLLLDGALERINESSFDAHDIPFTEGDDPVVINAELLEKIEA